MLSGGGSTGAGRKRYLTLRIQRAFFDTLFPDGIGWQNPSAGSELPELAAGAGADLLSIVCVIPPVCHVGILRRETSRKELPIMELVGTMAGSAAVLGRVRASVVNLLAIHNDSCGSGDAKPHFVASDVHDRDADILAHTDRFTDFSVSKPTYGPSSSHPTRRCIFARGLPNQAISPAAVARRFVEVRHRDGPLVPSRTGGLIRVNQVACGGWGTEENSVHARIIPEVEARQQKNPFRSAFCRTSRT